MDDRIEVTLTGPAKIDGQRRAAGETLGVSFLVARQLEASGLIEPIDIGEVAATDPLAPVQIESLKSELSIAKARIEELTAENIQIRAESDVLAGQTAELVTANARIEELSIENNALRAEIAVLKKSEDNEGGDKGAGETPPGTDDGQPVEQTTKPASKKQATAKG